MAKVTLTVVLTELEARALADVDFFPTIVHLGVQDRDRIALHRALRKLVRTTSALLVLRDKRHHYPKKPDARP